MEGHMSTQNLDTALTQIEAAEKTLAALTEKRADIVARAEAISIERRKISFDVHANGDPALRKRLDKLNGEGAMIDGELQSIDAALHEGALRLEKAQRAELELASKKAAAEARRKFAHLVKLAETADQALAAFTLASCSMKSDLDTLHGLGQAMPTTAQFQTYCSLATHSCLMHLPWARTMEARHLPPSDRRTFTALFKGWSEAANRQLDAHIGAAKELDNVA
jgi:hypothetical protein